MSDRKQAEQDREQLLERERTAREEAQAANRIKDEFLAVLSGEVDRQQALTAGFQMHIAKPVDPDQLVKAIVALTVEPPQLPLQLDFKLSKHLCPIENKIITLADAGQVLRMN